MKKLILDAFIHVVDLKGLRFDEVKNIIHKDFSKLFIRNALFKHKNIDVVIFL